MHEPPASALSHPKHLPRNFAFQGPFSTKLAMPKILMLCGEQRREVSPLYLQARVKVDVEPAVDGLVGRRIGKFICSKRCGPGSQFLRLSPPP